MKQAPFVIEEHEGVIVVRDDLVPGGTKSRFLPYLIKDADEIVFGGPFCGGAPLALSVLGKQTGQKVTIFYAKRQEWHPRQKQVKANGAKIVEVAPGYMTVVQKRARDYAAKKGVLFLPLGFDVPAASDPFIAAMSRARKQIAAKWGEPTRLWCATGSGMLARCLGHAFPDSRVRGIAVGLASRHGYQEFPGNVSLTQSPYRFEKECNFKPPFSCDPNYDAKAWEECQAERAAAGGQTRHKVEVFWNVMGAAKEG